MEIFGPGAHSGASTGGEGGATPPRAMSTVVWDVVICGGGLAGLTLGLQLRQRDPERRVLVIERQRRPLPDACHKVGESSVEIGAHYFEKILGLRPYLD